MDTTHDCFHGAYSAFSRFRESVAIAVGIPLPLMVGFFEDIVPDYATVNPSMGMSVLLHRIKDMSRFLPIRWESLKPDPLHKLLHHSDCEGHLEVRDLVPLADRLEEIAPNLDAESADRALTFAKGCRLAARKKQRVAFR